MAVVRRVAAVFALLVGCAPARPQVAAIEAVGPREPAVTEVRQAAEPAEPVAPQDCPEPRAGARLRVDPGLRVSRVASWDGVRSLRPASGGHANLPGEVTGLLWSVRYANDAGDCRSDAQGERVEYAFSRDHEPGYALYFQSRGEGFNFLRDWQVPLPDGGVARYDAAMLGPRSGAGLCLRACAHLVTLAVNGGRGGGGIHFVATAVKVIDGEVPLAIPDVLEDLRVRFSDARRDEERELRRLYGEARRGLPPAVGLGERVDGPIHVEPTWLVAASALEVLVWREGQATGERRTGAETVPPADCPPGSPCAYRESGTFALFEVATIRSEVAARYVVDRTGALVEETLYAPRIAASSGVDRRRQ